MSTSLCLCHSLAQIRAIAKEEMAEGKTEFVYCDVQLLKDQSLGSGCYGGVCRAKCDGLVCAA